MQRIIPEIDKIHVSAPYGFDRIMTKEFSNYKYRKNGILLDSGIKKLTRYAKDYEVGGTKFTLLLVSFSKGVKTIEKKLDSFAKDINKNNKYKSLAATATLVPTNLGEAI